MPEMYRVKLFSSHRALAPMLTTLIAARTKAEANRMARDAARAVGATYWQVEG